MSYGLSMGTHESIRTGQVVTFSQGDDNNTQLEGIVTRIWPGGRTVTVKAEGRIAGTYRTFVRDITSVHAGGR
jgi:hypothetical protein